MKTRVELVRKAAAVLLAAGVVTAGLEVGSTGAPVAVADELMAPYYSDDELPPFPNVLEYPLGTSLAVNGMPVRISHFTTPSTAVQVRDFYLDAFQKRGARTRVFDSQDKGFTVSAMIGTGTDQALVVISPSKDGCDVFPAVYPMRTEATGTSTPDEDIPFSPRAVGIMKVADGAQGEMVTYQEPTLKVGDAAAFARDDLLKKGWVQKEFTPKFGKGAQVVMAKGARVARISFSPYTYQPLGATAVVHYGAEE